MRITEKCSACGECQEGFTFKAISQDDDMFAIDLRKRDVGGDCYTICENDALEIVIEDP